ncbi:protein FAR1-RELATED SEQUENCE [Citrus sinensis]|nr:protein FAR1-RELATED SEQUENCE [Citrus sinensis]
MEENNMELMVEKVVEPTVGMSFDSPDEMFEYYKAFGLQEGFPVMHRSCRKRDDGSLRYVTFTCRRNGKSKAELTNVLWLQPNQKIGCNAKIGGRLDFISGKWVIGNLILEHNHVVSPSKSSFKSIVIEPRGFENVSFLERDARNHVDNVRRLRLGKRDVVAIQRYFKKMQTKNDGFFFSIDLDGEGRLQNVFWADPRNRAAYKDFGDVVTFDTTYLTNKYDMQFSPFVGVNHHVQIVFPNTKHRWCLWHILKKMPEKLGRYAEYHAIRVSLLSVVYDSRTPVEFEESWHDIESMNAFFDGYVNSKTTLKQFVEKYEKAMESKIEKEWQADARSFSQRLPCRTSFAMEKQVEEVYTISKFQEFQQELVNKIYCEVFSCGVLSRNRVQLLPEKYILRRWRKDVRRFSSKVKVIYDARSSSIEHQRYKKECTIFYDVAEVASKNEESHKNIMGWIEKVMKDVSLNVRCDGDDTTIDGGSSSNIQDPVVTQRKGRPPCQRKQKQFKRPKQKSNNVSINTTIEDAEIHDLSSQMATTIPTQESNMAMQPQQAPLQHAFFPPYYQYWMNYGPAHHVHLQHAPQQNFQEANQGEFSTNEPSM